MLATENLAKLNTAAGQLRWMFRLHDGDGDGKVEVGTMSRILVSLLTFRGVEGEQCEGLVQAAMTGYNLSHYEEENMMVTEEEFVYDSNSNRLLFSKEFYYTNKHLTIIAALYLM